MSKYTIENGYKKTGVLAKRLFVSCELVAVLGLGYLGYTAIANSNDPGAKPVSAQSATPPVKQAHLTTPMPWPGYGQAAYGVADQGVLAVSTDSAPKVPVASLAKVITALTILKEKPLAPGEQGPMITITEQDIASYENYVRQGGAVVPIEVGEQISEYQALQAMLMPSANNMADTLARWAFGSIDNYSVQANKMLREMGLTETTVADASGFSPHTIGTAHDLVQLGLIYMQNPLLREIAAQPEATVPFAGKIRNYNSLENKDGIVGIKVGNTDEAGRCFLVADMRDGKPVATASVLGAENLQTAMKDAVSILKAGNTGYDQLKMQ